MLSPSRLFTVLALTLAPQAAAATLEGRVVKVAEGDTVTVLVGREQHRVRLQGIDAPERDQPYGKASGRSLAAVVAGKEVRVEYDKRDRYGRIVGVVWVVPPGSRCEGEPGCPKTLDAGLYQLTIGMAWWYRRYSGEQSPEDRGQYEFAETEARAKRAGLWQEPDPVAPWDWRRGQRAPTASTSSDWCATHRYCRDMASCAEARRAFTECGRTRSWITMRSISRRTRVADRCWRVECSWRRTQSAGKGEGVGVTSVHSASTPTALVNNCPSGEVESRRPSVRHPLCNDSLHAALLGSGVILVPADQILMVT
jgi:endonuclease YncB( thermonuclease family)